MTGEEAAAFARELDQLATKLFERGKALREASSAILRLERDRGMMSDTEAVRQKALDLLSAETP